MRGHRLNYREFDQATEILCDFYSAVAVSEFKVWTTIASRIRINMGSGWLVVGNTQATAADLGAFTAGQVRQATVEVMVPYSSGSRHEELPLMIDLGV
jgi:hypothetical protein